MVGTTANLQVFLLVGREKAKNTARKTSTWQGKILSYAFLRFEQHKQRKLFQKLKNILRADQ